MILLSDISNIVPLLNEGGVLWAFVGIAVMLIPKLLEWARAWRKDTKEDKSDQRKDLFDRMTSMEEIITNQQARYMTLHEQLIQERESSQLEKMNLQNNIFDLERRVKVLESIMQEHEIVFDEDSEHGTGI